MNPSSMKSRARARITALVMACVITLAALVVPAGASVEKASSSSGTLTVGYDFAFQGGMNFDPIGAITGLSAYLAHLVMGGLFWYNADGTLRPDLATGYKQIDDRTLEVTIRPNLTFSDGTPLTADNFKASIDRLTQARTNTIRPAMKGTSVDTAASCSR